MRKAAKTAAVYIVLPFLIIAAAAALPQHPAAQVLQYFLRVPLAAAGFAAGLPMIAALLLAAFAVPSGTGGIPEIIVGFSVICLFAAAVRFGAAALQAEPVFCRLKLLSTGNCTLPGGGILFAGDNSGSLVFAEFGRELAGILGSVLAPGMEGLFLMRRKCIFEEILRLKTVPMRTLQVCSAVSSGKIFYSPAAAGGRRDSGNTVLRYACLLLPSYGFSVMVFAAAPDPQGTLFEDLLYYCALGGAAMLWYLFLERGLREWLRRRRTDACRRKIREYAPSFSESGSNAEIPNVQLCL